MTIDERKRRLELERRDGWRFGAEAGGTVITARLTRDGPVTRAATWEALFAMIEPY